MTDWRDTLKTHLEKTEETKLKKEEENDLLRFMTNVVLPALEQLAAELEQHGRSVTIRNDGTAASITVQYEGDEEILYRVRGRVFPNNIMPYAEVRFRERKGLRFLRVESMFRGGVTEYSLADVTAEQIIQNFLDNYIKRVKHP